MTDKKGLDHLINFVVVEQQTKNIIITAVFTRTSGGDGRVRGQVLAGAAPTSPLGEIRILIFQFTPLGVTGGDGGTPPSP